jgi:hypothetical protein
MVEERGDEEETGGRIEDVGILSESEPAEGKTNQLLSHERK